ncbi:hypothetical protein [Stenotrophomonas cyclobalanopsidis]|uniref:SpaN/EivJ family type III secretion system needle length determinant n=1 Tax=Stenotrophomonas cyclobalanopsidis TaxID=2771362 RepID=UPI00345FE228
MSMKVSEPAPVPQVIAPTPVPLPERLRERAAEGGRCKDADHKQEAVAGEEMLGAIANGPAPWPMAPSLLPQGAVVAMDGSTAAVDASVLLSQLVQVGSRAASTAEQPGQMTGGAVAAAGRRALVVGMSGNRAAMAAADAGASSQASVTLPLDGAARVADALPGRRPVAEVPATVEGRSDARAPDAAAPVPGALPGRPMAADVPGAVEDRPDARAPDVAATGDAKVSSDLQASEAAQETPRHPAAAQDAAMRAVPVVTVQKDAASFDAGTSGAAQAQHREVAQQAHRQQARAQAQVALQAAAQVARSADTATHFNVAFNSWGAGHAVVARLEQGRVHLQPSTRQVADALAGAAPLGEDVALLPVEAMDALDERTDERRRRRSRQNPS